MKGTKCTKCRKCTKCCINFDRFKMLYKYRCNNHSSLYETNYTLILECHRQPWRKLYKCAVSSTYTSCTIFRYLSLHFISVYVSVVYLHLYLTRIDNIFVIISIQHIARYLSICSSDMSVFVYVCKCDQ